MPTTSATRHPPGARRAVGRSRHRPPAGRGRRRRPAGSPAGRCTRRRNPHLGRCRRCTATGTRDCSAPARAPAVVLALLGVEVRRRLAEPAALAPPAPGRRTSSGWRWLLALAFIDGTDGISRVLGNGDEYLADRPRGRPTCRPCSTGFVERIPMSPPGQLGHPRGRPPAGRAAVLRRAGPGRARRRLRRRAGRDRPGGHDRARGAGDRARPRRRGRGPARRAVPGAGPAAAVFMAVSADAVFGAVAAWGLAALAMAATRRSRPGRIALVGAGRPAAGWLRAAVLRAAAAGSAGARGAGRGALVAAAAGGRGRGRCRGARCSRRTASPGGTATRS